MRIKSLVDVDELVRDGESLARLRAVRGVVDFDFAVFDSMATVDVGEKSVVESVVFNLESAQVSLKRFEADGDRERRVCDQDVVYRFSEIALPVLELGEVELFQWVRNVERFLT